MSLLYKVAMEHFYWGPREFRTVLRALLSPEAVDRRAELERWLGERYQTDCVQLFNSGRSALEASLAHIRLRQQKQNKPERNQVLTPSLICDSVPRKIVQTGFTPVFYEMTAGVAPDLKDAVNRIEERTTAALLVPHLYGQVVDVSSVASTCRERGIALIEDCAPSALLCEPRTGTMSGLTGDYTVLSFQLGKTLVAGGGGALLRRGSAADASRVELQKWTPEQERALARSKRGFLLRYGYEGVGYYLSKLSGPLDLGLAYSTYNQLHPMSAVDSALVFCQIDRFPALRLGRQNVLDGYRSRFPKGDPSGNPSLPQLDHGATYVQRLFAQFSKPVVNWSADGTSASPLSESLRNQGLQTQKTYCPAHQLQEFGRWPASLPQTEALARHLLAIPSQPGLPESSVEWVRNMLEQNRTAAI